MKRSLLPLVVLAAVLVGCGSDDGDGDTTAEPKDDSLKVCQASTPTVFQADLDGDGTREPVEFSPRSGDCPAFVKYGDQTANLDLDRAITAKELSIVTVPGHPGDLVLYTFRHPRGGFEARLFAAVDGQPREVTRQGGALVPFVATDAPTGYTSVACTKDGFAVTSAVAHEPIGVMAAWDVTTTEYAGATLQEGATDEVQDNVRDEALATEFPDLVKNGLFENC